jgi:HlyD family secretion protein
VGFAAAGEVEGTAMSGRGKLAAGVAVALLGAGALLWRGRNASAEAGYTVAALDRGEIADVVGATGVLQAVTTVQVGSQVSGIIQSLGADFNSVVKKGQVVARLDPSLFEARVAQMRANLAAASANLERSRAEVDDARQKFQRARELNAQQLLPQADLETAQSNHQGAAAQVKASEAAVEQARANLNQAQVDLAHTVIATPIDGVVIARNVDVGQTVAASFQAPVLFVIANDLAHMQVNASIDEADVGKVKAGQEVRFTVDAHPDKTFVGRVEQVRLQPITSQNVVTYNTIISVDNPELLLMPGMTATVSVVVEKRENVLRLPAAALRFRPEGFGDKAASGAPGASAAPGQRGNGDRGSGQRGAGERTGRRERSGGAGADGVPREAGGKGRRGLVFVLDAQGQPQPTRVALGLSDGRNTEVLDGLTDGAQVITGLRQAGTAAASGPAAPASANPFAPGRPQPRTR